MAVEPESSRSSRLGGEGGGDELADVFGGDVEVEDEARDIEGAEARGGFGEELPGGRAVDVQFVKFVVAVAHAAEAAEKIAEMDGGDEADERQRAVRVLGRVVEFDNGLNIGREVPVVGEKLAGVAMREAHGFLFGFEKRPAAADGHFDGGFEFVVEESGVDDFTDVVEEAAEIDFFGFGEGDFFGELLGDEGAAEGMLPEGHWIERPVPFWGEAREVRGPEDVAEAA